MRKDKMEGEMPVANYLHSGRWDACDLFSRCATLRVELLLLLGSKPNPQPKIRRPIGRQEYRCSLRVIVTGRESRMYDFRSYQNAYRIVSDTRINRTARMQTHRKGAIAVRRVARALASSSG